MPGSLGALVLVYLVIMIVGWIICSSSRNSVSPMDVCLRRRWTFWNLIIVVLCIRYMIWGFYQLYPDSAVGFNSIIFMITSPLLCALIQMNLFFVSSGFDLESESKWAYINCVRQWSQ